MMGPDYAWWRGIYDVAQHFYFKFLPEAKKYDDPEVNEYIDKLITEDNMHVWMNQATGKLKEDIKSGELQKIYKELYPDSK